MMELGFQPRWSGYWVQALRHCLSVLLLVYQAVRAPRNPSGDAWWYSGCFHKLHLGIRCGLGHKVHRAGLALPFSLWCQRKGMELQIWRRKKLSWKLLPIHTLSVLFIPIPGEKFSSLLYGGKLGAGSRIEKDGGLSCLFIITSLLVPWRRGGGCWWGILYHLGLWLVNGQS